MKYPNETAQVMVSPGCFSEDRTISRIREHPSQRFADEVYLTGYISLAGKRVRVITGYWGDVEIWQLDTDAPDWPTCPACNAQLDIGSAQMWQCWQCIQTQIRARTSSSLTAL